MNLDEEIRNVKRLREMSYNAQEEIREKSENLRERILVGETTGDEIRDFVIVTEKTLSEEAEQPYRQLQEMLKGKEGEKIFVARVNESRQHHYESYHHEALMYLGILDSDELAFDFENLSGNKNWFFDFRSKKPYEELLDVEGKAPSIILPVSKYALKKTGLIGTIGTTSNHNWELKWEIEEKMKINSLELSRGLKDKYYFLESLSPRHAIFGGRNKNLGHHSPLKMVLVKIGEEDIREFFENQVVHEVKEYEQAVKILDSSI